MSRYPESLSSSATSPARILVVEDETLFAKAVCKHLAKAGFECEAAATLAQARAALTAKPPDLVLLDMRLPDGSGLDFLNELRTGTAFSIPVVVLTAFGEIEDAVAAMKHQAADYLTKPIDLDKLLNNLEHVLAKSASQAPRTPARIQKPPIAEPAELLGDSPPVCRIREQIQRIGSLGRGSDEIPPTVLILGETGTGKDLAARLLHRASRRCQQPFIHVDCAALPKELIETELFGHEKGAFTSAHAERTGLIEEAGDGTVFLDEIAELPLELQAKLLAVLERRALRRVGSSRERPVNAWFIAATNRDLEDMVRTGRFRSDLYYRLKVLTLALPPLRQRGDDIVLLARHFARCTAQRYKLPQAEFTTDALSALRAHTWPGNIRELSHLIERAVLLSNGETLNTELLMLEENQLKTGEPPTLPGMTLETAEAALIRQALAHAEGNVSEAARQLGITRMTLRYRMQKYGISAPR